MDSYQKNKSITKCKLILWGDFLQVYPYLVLCLDYHVTKRRISTKNLFKNVSLFQILNWMSLKYWIWYVETTNNIHNTNIARTEMLQRQLKTWIRNQPVSMIVCSKLEDKEIETIKINDMFSKIANNIVLLHLLIVGH